MSTAVVTVLAAGGLVVLTQAKGTPALAPPPALAPATDEVRQMDLVDQIEVEGKLGHGAPVPITGRKSGTLTWLPPPGQVVDRGQVLYAVDAVGIPVLFGSVPLYRELGPGVPDGPDVLQLQENLIALGHLRGPATSKFGDAVQAALKRWQTSRKVPDTGRLPLGDAVVQGGPVRVAAVSARLGAPAEGDLMTVTGTDRLVTAELDESRRGYAAVGGKVTVLLRNGRSVPGQVRAMADKSADTSTDKTGGGKNSGQVITIALDDPATTPDSGAVTVTLAGERRAGVLVVGIRALVASQDGGYALEALTDDGSRRLIPVTVGMFATGLVEVSGAQLRPGLRVATAG
nr:Putative peptidoglycan binding domain 1 [Kibdelosporangium sp. MJ126-NF4]